MKKTLINLCFILFLCNFYSLCASTIVEVRSAAFFHASQKFRRIYGNVSGCYEVEASTTLCGCYDGWVNFDWFRKHGKSIGMKNSTRCDINNTSFGIKINYSLCNPFYLPCCDALIAYAGLGPSFGKIWLKNRSHCRHEKKSKCVVGGVFKCGIQYFFNCYLFLDLFVDYLYQPVQFHERVDIGGVKLGAGLGVHF